MFFGIARTFRVSDDLIVALQARASDTCRPSVLALKLDFWIESLPERAHYQGRSNLCACHRVYHPRSCALYELQLTEW